MKVEDNVIYRFYPRGGYGFSLSVPARVVEVDTYRARVRLFSAKGKAHLVWAPLHELSLIGRPAGAILEGE
jgi:hypothetical protein